MLLYQWGYPVSRILLLGSDNPTGIAYSYKCSLIFISLFHIYTDSVKCREAFQCAAPRQIPAAAPCAPYYPFPGGNIHTRVVYRVSLWADMNAATPLGSWGRGGALPFPLSATSDLHLFIYLLGCCTIFSQNGFLINGP